MIWLADDDVVTSECIAEEEKKIAKLLHSIHMLLSRASSLLPLTSYSLTNVL